MKNSLDKFIIDYSLSNSIDFKLLKEYKILPIKKEQLHIVVATCDEYIDLNSIKKLFNQPIKFFLVEKDILEYEYSNYDLKKDLFFLAKNSISLGHQTNDINIFLDRLLEFCIKSDISDIHIEALKDSMVIRLRVDGVLKQFFKFEKKLYDTISAVVKYLSNLDISQKRIPLNGRFAKIFGAKSFDFRVSTLPTIYLESLVIRVLDNKNIHKSLENLGFCKQHLDLIYQNISLTQGLILVTGPTGSGKTTTLYSMLNHINSSEKKIITIEDPVEYKLDGVMQVNLNPSIDLDYHTVLKNVLRQDPDILLIGEIRDSLSLHIAIRAALTGHLVIATIHTNNALDTITRLLDLEAEHYLIASVLKLIVAQRLLRVLCDDCKVYDKNTNSYVAKGCPKCNLLGYKGRTIVSEVLECDDQISSLIAKKSSLDSIKEYLKDKSFITLKENGKMLLTKGITSKDEFLSKI